MKQYCQYHPTIPAHWHCDKCAKSLCPKCVDARDMGGFHQGEKLHMCPNCNIEVRWLGVANIIDPFWQRIPQFFLYPFSLRPLLLMVVISVIAALFKGPGVVGLLATAAVWGLSFKYAYSILQNTAGGDLTTPKLNIETLSENFGPVVKQFGIFFVLIFVAALIAKTLGFLPATLFSVLSIIFLPSMIILLVTTGSLIQAVNPMMFVTLAFRIGWGYLLMYFFNFLLGGAPTLITHYVIQHLPPIAQIFLFTLVKTYYTFISYHLMGYVILQYHEDIGYKVDFEDFRETESDGEEAGSAGTDPHSRMLVRVNQLIKDGDHSGAIDVIENETRQTGIIDPLLSERYYTLLKMTGAHQKLVTHAKVHLNLLVQANQKEPALSVYQESLSKDPQFLPSSGSLFKLGSWLNEIGKGEAAIQTFNKLAKAYPEDPLVPKSYFRAAQIFNDRLLNPEKAKKILKGVMLKYPNHDIIPFVERYLGEMG